MSYEEKRLKSLSKNELLSICEKYKIIKCKSKNKSMLIELITNKINIIKNDTCIQVKIFNNNIYTNMAIIIQKNVKRYIIKKYNRQLTDN